MMNRYYIENQISHNFRKNTKGWYYQRLTNTKGYIDIDAALNILITRHYMRQSRTVKCVLAKVYKCRLELYHSPGLSASSPVCRGYLFGGCMWGLFARKTETDLYSDHGIMQSTSNCFSLATAKDREKPLCGSSRRTANCSALENPCQPAFSCFLEARGK